MCVWGAASGFVSVRHLPLLSPCHPINSLEQLISDILLDPKTGLFSKVNSSFSVFLLSWRVIGYTFSRGCCNWINWPQHAGFMVTGCLGPLLRENWWCASHSQPEARPVPTWAWGNLATWYLCGRRVLFKSHAFLPPSISKSQKGLSYKNPSRNSLRQPFAYHHCLD